MTNVATTQINSQLLVFVTDSSVRVLEAKVRTVSDQLIDLVPSTQANAFSLANLPVGVYTLDVITQKGNAKAAYEGILVISQQPTTVISETTKNIINQGINQNTRVVIDDDDDDDEDDNCPAGYIGKPPFCERRVCMKNSDAEGCPPLPRPPDCPQGFVGKPPFCEPVDCNENPEAEGCEGLPSPPQDPCDTDNPPDFCEEPPVCIDPSCAPTECPDGRIVPPGQSCDEKENDEEEDEGEETPPKEILGEGDAAGDEEDAGGEEEQGGDGENGDEQVREEGRE
jgi:hypothetical protein